MIGELDIYPLLENEFSVLRPDLRLIDDVKSPYKIARCFVKFTINSLMSGDLKTSRKCLLLAEKFFEAGDHDVRKAMETVFLFYLAPGFKDNKAFIFQNSPTLFNEFKKQIEIPSPAA